MNDFTYENTRRIQYGDGESGEAGDGAIFIPVCKKCGRFVKSDETVSFIYEGPPKDQPNATCRKCGRTQMIFEGYD